MLFQLIVRCLSVWMILGGLANSVLADENYQKARQQMVQAIEQDVRQTSWYLDKSALNEQVLQALRKVPRHAFVPDAYRPLAYENRPLPIGYGQTISQPYIVAIMTDLLNVKPTDRVLEIGTGSGYQAAVLAQLVDAVFTIEIIEPLANEASARLKQLGYRKVHSRLGDGYYGWPEQAPFDAIVVTAAASHIPPPLIRQLKAGGRMVIPVGGRFMVQQLVLVEKNKAGQVKTRQILPVQFVPLTGRHE